MAGSLVKHMVIWHAINIMSVALDYFIADSMLISLVLTFRVEKYLEWVHCHSNLISPRAIDEEREVLTKEQLHRIKSIPHFSEFDFHITLPKVMGAIKSLKKGKAVGIDNISNEMILFSLDVMAPIYGKIFNSILNNHHHPTLWKTGIINNLYKSGDPYDPNNYRGLTINSCLGKAFNTILNNRLSKFIADNKIIDPTQIGFKNNARTADHIFILNTLIRNFLAMKNEPWSHDLLISKGIW